MTQIVSIGILAHDEAGGIARTLASLAAQTLLDASRAAALGVSAVQVLIIPNGCTDDTAAVAQHAMQQLPPFADAAVHALPEPGKAGAWNAFVHQFARPDATLLTLMDADIEFGSSDVLEALVRRLIDDPICDVATDRAIKDYRDKPLTPFNRFSRRVSRQQTADGGLCGQLYCGRATVLRRIWLPTGLPVEDGFIAAMLVTKGFTSDDSHHAIGYVAGAWHYYEPLTRPADFVRHETRIIVGSVINAWLFSLMWEAGARSHAGEDVHRRNEENPEWVDALRRQHSAGRRWVVPNTFIWWRLSWLRGQPIRRLLVRAPVALAATFAALPAVLRANAILRRAGASRHW